MSNAKQTRSVTSESRKALLYMLETLPDTVFVIDNTETIVSANASAQLLAGTTREEICGKPLWRAAPHLVSPSLYQAVQKAKQTREPTDVAYVSPTTNRWLHVSLSPTDEGLALLFQEQREPLPLQHALSRNEPRYRDLLESFSHGVTIVTPDGLVLDINQRPLSNAHLRREEVVGRLEYIRETVDLDALLQEITDTMQPWPGHGALHCRGDYPALWGNHHGGQRRWERIDLYGDLALQEGWLTSEQGKYAEAEPLSLCALHIREHRLGVECPETAETMCGLARLREVQGNSEGPKSGMLVP